METTPESALAPVARVGEKLPKNDCPLMTERRMYRLFPEMSLDPGWFRTQTVITPEIYLGRLFERRSYDVEGERKTAINYIMADALSTDPLEARNLWRVLWALPTADLLWIARGHEWYRQSVVAVLPIDYWGVMLLEADAAMDNEWIVFSREVSRVIAPRVLLR
ncbi:MAG TPA: hypothetical protein VJB98_01080 [Candidatus Paceibacterota bacterium]